MKREARRRDAARARRTRRPAEPQRRRRGAGRAGAGWIGRDLARLRPGGAGLRGRPLAAAVVAALVCALALVALRIDILRARYALAEAIREEKTLQEEERQHLARVETLRDPARLAALARERGFERPARVLALRDARPGPEGP